MQALILAGGEGTRLRPLTIYTPKPVVPIVNRPFLYYQLELLKRAGIKEITLSLSYQPNKIADIFGDGDETGLKIYYTVEASPLGTAGAYKNAQEHLTQTAVVFNGDILTNINIADVIAFHREKKAAATIVLTPVENPSAYGLVETESDGRVRRFLEKPKPEEITCNTINAGIYVLEPHILNHIPAGEKFSFEYQLFPALLANNEPFYAYTMSEYWLDIGTPQRYQQANDDLINGRIPTFDAERKPLNVGGEGDPVKIDPRSAIDPTCSIKSGVEITNSVLGANCVIEERVKIENSVVLAGARIGKAAEIRNSIIGKSAIIGRNSKIEGAALGDKSSLTDYTII
ncbi:MAG TPA: NDP-sugar synthase [Blastocatellia bacterium]|nr:NDP-sugar synthase [Blastocatellia bacterium]HMV87314.1 NDP-sugar synthase [Blastocatellia bacterium]HMX27026.1 NDP-sugar synthase [Blastocatellia bacterium]HMY74159.1 NDP-sugar synthase [Blastocatellia bacterium]HMZ21447.1 NDP-sugar synthase [Blastocatellia bacterium]